MVSPAASPNVANKEERLLQRLTLSFRNFKSSYRIATRAAEHGVEPTLMLDAIKLNFALDQFTDDSKEISLALFCTHVVRLEVERQRTLQRF